MGLNKLGQSQSLIIKRFLEVKRGSGNGKGKGKGSIIAY